MNNIYLVLNTFAAEVTGMGLALVVWQPQIMIIEWLGSLPAHCPANDEINSSHWFIRHLVRFYVNPKMLCCAPHVLQGSVCGVVQ